MRDHDSQRILAWYDKDAREMPWRVGPKERAKGVQPNPYHVWLSEIMLQQTTVAAVGKYFVAFTERWPRLENLASARDDDVMAAWAGLGYYARARNLLACARFVVSQYDGRFPENYAELLKLPGVGPYTAAAIAAIAFDQPETVVDGNVERVIARLHMVLEPMPNSKRELRLLAEARTPSHRPGDYAQAMMDLGATICTPRSPRCGVCPLSGSCIAFDAGIQSELPKRQPKRMKPTRYGYVYLGRSPDGEWLMERREPKGLLGGMLGWPGTDWTEAVPAQTPPVEADWYQHAGEVRHTFTHFHLHLKVMTARLSGRESLGQRFFVPKDEFSDEELPTLMRKAYDFGKHWEGWSNSDE